MPSWLAPLLTWSYWFTSYPAPFTGLYFWIIIGLAAGSFVLGLALSLTAPHLKDPSSRRLLKKFGNLGLTFGALAAVSFFFTQTSTPTLGSRFWFALWVIVVIIWLVFIGKYALKVAPRERDERAKQMVNKKYLSGR